MLVHASRSPFLDLKILEPTESRRATINDNSLHLSVLLLLIHKNHTFLRIVHFEGFAMKRKRPKNGFGIPLNLLLIYLFTRVSTHLLPVPCNSASL